MTKLNVSVTQNHRLTTDETERTEATQFILQRRHIVDPTKSPSYKAPADGSTPPVTEEWRNDKYYALNENGITAAAKLAILRDTDVSRAETLADALRMYAEATAKLAGVIESALRVPGA